MPAGPPVRIDKYDIRGLIGRGGMGVVYKASDSRIGRLVAIKVMTSSFGDDYDLLKRFYREAQSAGNLQHPNILTIHEMGDLHGKPYLVMEFIDGENLNSIIRSRRDLSLDAKLGLVIQICNGLQYAHERHIVHRDIKPSNIMVTTNGTVKIVDFGLAHVGTESLTRLGQVMGSISYMSPEQINGERVDFRTDIFATGVVLYQLLTYALPFQGPDTGSTLLKIIHEPPPPLETFVKVPVELQNIVHRALAKDREARYPSAEEFAVDLGQIVEQLRRDKIEQRLQIAEEFIAASELEKANAQLTEVLKFDRQHRRGTELMREVRQRIQKRLQHQQTQEMKCSAEKAVERGDLEGALLVLEEALKLDNSNEELIKFRDSVQEKKARTERVRQALQKPEPLQTDGKTGTALRAHGSAKDQGNARKQVKYISVVNVAKEQVREALAKEDFAKASAIVRSCRDQVGDIAELALLDNEIAVWQREVFTRRVERAIADARTLLIGRSFRLALDTLAAVADCVELVSPELKAQYNSLCKHAQVGAGPRPGEASSEPAAPGSPSEEGPSHTLQQLHWTLAGAAIPSALPPASPADDPDTLAAIPRSYESVPINVEESTHIPQQRTVVEPDNRAKHKPARQARPPENKLIRSWKVHWIIVVLLALVAIGSAARMFVPHRILKRSPTSRRMPYTTSHSTYVIHGTLL